MVAEVVRLTGRTVGFGHAVGPVFKLEECLSAVPEFAITKEQIPQEWMRFEKVCEEAERQLLECKTYMGNGSEIERSEVFDIQIALLKDSYILQELKRTMQNKLKNVEACLVSVVEKCVKMFREKDSSPVLGTYGDLQDVSKRLLCLLEGRDVRNGIVDKKGNICVAKNLEPSDVITLKEAGIAGILLECDCTASHAVILARSLRVPILVGVKDVCSKMNDGAIVEIDSEMGACWVNDGKENVSITSTLPIPDTISLDGQSIRFYLSYDGYDSPLLERSLISGVGLVRSEMLFFNREDFPDEEEQFLFYKDIVASANGKPVVLRTLDVGGDKLPRKQFQQELNPSLGLRGIRYSLKNEDMFCQQLLAILRASALGCVRILYPMISDVGELIQANKFLEKCKWILSDRKIDFDPEIKVGVMLETPSAVLCMNDLAAHCDFFSVGTNDLIQYTLVVDRTNPAVANLYQMTHPAIFRCLRLIARQSSELKKEVYVCGELPNGVVPFLMCLSLGFRSFVVYDNYVSYLANLCNKVDKADLEILIAEAQNKTSSGAVFSVFEKYYKKLLNETKKV